MKVERLRFRYRVAAEAVTFGQRELVRAWEQAASAAGLPLAFSEGKRPAAQISLAAPLPLGVTSGGELADVYFAERVEPGVALAQLAQHLPPGVEALTVEEIGLAAPSLQSQLRWAEYEVTIPSDGLAPDAVRCAVESLLAAPTLPSEYRRDTKVRAYDLRPLVLDVRVAEEVEGAIVLRMRLRAEPEMTARADQVVLALGLPEAVRIHRCGLYVEEGQAAVMAYRKRGEPEGAD